MSEKEETTEEVKTEPVVEEPKVEEPKPEPVVEETTAKSTTDISNLSLSAGTGLTVFSGACPLCGARIASGVVKNGKVNCPTCKQDF